MNISDIARLKTQHPQHQYLDVVRVMDALHYVIKCNIHGNTLVHAKFHGEGINNCPYCEGSRPVRLYESYLTEDNMHQVLAVLFPDAIITCQFNFDEKGIRGLKYDYLVDLGTDKFLLEFDGAQHYTQYSKTDIIKDNLATLYDITLIRIPYFVQLDKATIEHYFRKFVYNTTWSDPIYPHGYIYNSNLCATPSSYCAKGLCRFVEEMKSLPFDVMFDILCSLQTKKMDNRLPFPLEEYISNDTITTLNTRISKNELFNKVISSSSNAVSCSEHVLEYYPRNGIIKNSLLHIERQFDWRSDEAFDQLYKWILFDYEYKAYMK